MKGHRIGYIRVSSFDPAFFTTIELLSSQPFKNSQEGRFF